MFKMQQQPTFWGRVEFAIPDQPGRPIKAAFEVEFPRLSNDALKELGERVSAEGLGDVELARELLKHRWRGIVDDQDHELELTPANVDRLLSIVGAAPAICRAFVDGLRGAVAKN
jgi:hypothetical protein